MARLSRKELADMRALEEEGERQNDISELRGGMRRMVGAGKRKEEPPSRDDTIHYSPEHGYSLNYADEEDVKGAHTLTEMKKKKMTKKDLMKKNKGGAYEGGKLLSRHLIQLHGAGWWDDFKSGFNSVVAPIAGVAKTVLPFVAPGVGSLASAGLGALGYGRHIEESDEECEGGARTGAYEGQGKLTITHGGKKKRHNKRAEIVKKVMKSKGLSMIEASSYVKEHGLY